MWTRNRFHNAVIATGLGAGIGAFVGVVEGGLTYLLSRYLVSADEETAAYISLSVVAFCVLAGSMYGGIGSCYDPLPDVDRELLMENVHDEGPELDLAIHAPRRVVATPISYTVYEANNTLIEKIKSEANYPTPLTPEEIQNYIQKSGPAALQSQREQECANYNSAIKCCYSQKVTLKPITFQSFDRDNRRPSMIFTADANQLIEIIRAHTEQNLHFTFMDKTIYRKGYSIAVEQFAEKVRKTAKPQRAQALRLFAPAKIDTVISSADAKAVPPSRLKIV